MASEYRHIKYFKKVNVRTNTHETFTDVENAKSSIGLTGAWLTAGSPTVSYALADSNTALAVTFEFASNDDQTTFKTAYGNAVADNWPAMATGNSVDDTSAIGVESLAYPGEVVQAHPANIINRVYLAKQEWLHQDGTISSEATFDTPTRA